MAMFSVILGIAAQKLGLSCASGCAKNLPRRKAAAIISQLDVQTCEFSGHSGSAEHRLTAEFLLLLRGGAAAHLQGGPDGAGRDSIDSDAFRSELLGQGFDEIHRSRFRLRIVV